MDFDLAAKLPAHLRLGRYYLSRIGITVLVAFPVHNFLRLERIQGNNSVDKIPEKPILKKDTSINC